MTKEAILDAYRSRTRRLSLPIAKHWRATVCHWATERTNDIVHQDLGTRLYKQGKRRIDLEAQTSYGRYTVDHIGQLLPDDIALPSADPVLFPVRPQWHYSL